MNNESIQKYEKEKVLLLFQKNLLKTLQKAFEMDKLYYDSSIGSSLKLDLSFLDIFLTACSEISKPLKKAWKILSFMILENQNMEDLRKEQIMIQNVYSNVFDEKLIRWFETAKVVVLKSWNKVLSDYETIHEYSSDLFKFQLDKILDRINQINLVSVEFLQMLNRLRQHFLDSWVQKLRCDAYSLSLNHDSFCEKFDNLEICLESFVISAQELMKSAADVRLERIYHFEGRIPTKRLSVIDNSDLSTHIDTSFITQGSSPTMENTEHSKEKEYYTFPKKPVNFETFNSSRIRVQKVIQMTWTECKQYLESLLSDEFVFISRITEHIKEKLYTPITLPFSTCGALRHLMNPYYSSLHNQTLGENRISYQQFQRNANISASSFSSRTNSFAKKDSEDDVDSLKDIFKLDCERLNSATSDDFHDFTSTVNQIEDMKISFIQMGETFFPLLEEKNVDSLSLFYIEYLNGRIFIFVNGDNSYVQSGDNEPFSITKLNEQIVKPIHYCIHDCIRQSRRQIKTENLTSVVEEKKDDIPQCNTSLFRMLYSSIKYLCIYNYVSNDSENTIIAREEDFPSIYRMLFQIFPKKKENSISTKQSLNDLRRSLGKADDKYSLERFTDNITLIEWIIRYRFELNSVFETALNFVYSKTLDLKLQKDKKNELLLLASDSFILIELVHHFVHALKGDTILTEYSFQSSIDKTGNHAVTSNNTLFVLKSILNGLKREVGKVLECYLGKISLDMSIFFESCLEENEGWFGQHYHQSKAKNKKSKRRIVPLKAGKKSILNDSLMSTLNGLHFVSGSYTEDVRGFMTEYCCKLVVNQYISCIERNHEENINYLTRKVKRTGERVRVMNRLTITLLDQLSEDKDTIVKSLNSIPNISIDSSLRDSILRNVNHLISIQSIMIESENSIRKTLKNNQVIPGKVN